MVRFSTRERTKVPALRKEREEAERLDKEHQREGRYSLATLTAKFLIWKEANNLSDLSVQALRKHIELHILPFFGEERDVRAVALDDLEEYKTARMRKVEAVTVCKELSTLRQVLRYAAEVHRLMPQAPTTRNPSFRYEPKWRLFTAEELATLLGELAKMTGRGKQALPYFLLMANTGMRGGETGAITWEMVDLPARVIRLPAEITKTRRARSVPLNDAAAAALELVKRPRALGRVFVAKHFYGSWRKACKAVKVWPARPHDLRHTFGSMLHAAGVPSPEVRDVLGHITMTMVNHYAHTYESRLHEAVATVVVNVPKNVPLMGQSVPEKASKGKRQNTGNRSASATVKS